MFFNCRFLSVIVFLFFFNFTNFGVAKSEGSQKDSIKVSFRSQLQGNSDFKKFKLNHPIKISHREIINHLASLRYKGTFLGNKEERIFPLPEVKKIAPVLVKAFAKVNPGKIIHVELKGKGGVTSGDIFSFKKYLNWCFDSIRGETFLQRNNVREWNIFAWKLVPKKGQLYFKSGSDKRIHKNWIISNLKLPVAVEKNEDDRVPLDILGTKSSNNNINPKLEEKLKFLKYLHNEKLVSEEEYKAQKKKLLDELF